MALNLDYDIGEAFKAIEEELIASMMRNMKRHFQEEDELDMDWTAWQAEQLYALDQYKRRTEKKYGKEFHILNDRIEELIRQANASGRMDQELEILKAIKKGVNLHRQKGSALRFFKVNDRKLNALIKATRADMEKAETAILRMSQDRYRQIIFNSQVYASTGAGTYEKAVDMATHDFMLAGLNCVQYKNGARHTLADYADMAIRTAAKRAYLQGEGEMRQEWGIHTVIINKRSDNPCPKCLPFVGKVMIDDVWSGGSRKDGDYPLMSEAVAAGLYHPRCRDSHTTYFPGISTPPGAAYTKREIAQITIRAKEEAEEQRAEQEAEKYKRLADNSLDPENQRIANGRAKEWRARYKTGNETESEYVENKRLYSDIKKQFSPLNESGVVDQLRKAYKGWVNRLSKLEKESVAKYTKNYGDKKPNRLFELINRMLRTGEGKSPMLQRHADNISGALKKAIAPYDLRVFRGVDVDPTRGAKIGEIFSMDQFISTSVIKDRAFEGTYKIEIWIHKGQRGAAYIEEISRMKKQREVLLDKDCFYRLLSREGNHIILEVIK